MSLLTDRLKEFKLELQYEDGSDTKGIITNYKPPRPVYFRKGTRTIGGYTQFQNNVASDCVIEFTVAFQIRGDSEAETLDNIETFKKFRENYANRFIFIDEFQTTYKGYIQDKFDLETPVEGDIYYISTQLLCSHPVTGWVSDDGSL
jgi:hypothetical protein